jgi:hypothetical protein
MYNPIAHSQTPAYAPQPTMIGQSGGEIIDCRDGFVTTRPTEDEIDQEYKRAKMMGGDFKFRTDEIGFFDPRLQNTDDNGLNTYQGRTSYKHVQQFLEAVEGALTTLPDYVIRAHLSKCLKGNALAWYNSQLPPGGKQFVKLGKGLENWKKLLTEKYKRTNSEIQRELQGLSFTENDIRQGKSITSFAINVARNLQEWNSTSSSDLARDEQRWIATIYDKLDPNFRLSIQDPTTDTTMRYDQFLKMIEQRAKIFREQILARASYSPALVPRQYGSQAQPGATQPSQAPFREVKPYTGAGPAHPMQQTQGNEARRRPTPAQNAGQGQRQYIAQPNQHRGPKNQFAPTERGGGVPGYSKPQQAFPVNDNDKNQPPIDDHGGPAPNHGYNGAGYSGTPDGDHVLYGNDQDEYP